MHTEKSSLVLKKRSVYKNRLKLASGRSLVVFLAEIYRSTSQTFIRNTIPRKDLTGLHLGCRNGDATFLLAEQLGSKSQLTGIDESEILLQAARNKQSELGLNNIHFEQSNVFAFQAGQNYDFIFTRSFISQISVDTSLLQRLFQGLIPEGLLLIQIIDQANFSSYPYNHAFTRSIELIESLKEKLYPAAVVMEELSEMLVQNGFGNIRISTVPPSLVNGNYRSVVSLSLETVSPELLKLRLTSPEELDALLIELRDFEKRETTMIGVPGILQVIARKRGEGS